MADLIAQGPGPGDRWRRHLVEGERCLIGRTTGRWSTPWDDRISRRHVTMTFQQGRLRIERLPESLNPVFFQGQRRDKFFVRLGEHFVIGSTKFTLAEEQVNISQDVPPPVTEKSYDPLFLRRVRFRNPDQRIAVLSDLPEVISRATSDDELFSRLINVLLAGVPRAEAAAILAVDPSASPASTSPQAVRVLHWDQRLIHEKPFSPSERLIRQAVAQGESVVYTWGAAWPSGPPAATWSGKASFTQSEDIDWAFCSPVLGDACRGWAVYLSGRWGLTGEEEPSPVADSADLRDDVKFTELVASTLGNLKSLHQMERRQAGLRSFFSPSVLGLMADEDPDQVLAPREADVAVLFCDLRGFSRAAEQMADDLFGLLERVSGALGVMTRHILQTGGVIGDFHGDAAMGFWGWPLAQQDASVRACTAALGIRAEFAAESGALADFQMGVGVASGAAVAGKIGTVDQVKVTVFGPVVNLASRLQDLTKAIGAPILLDEATAAAMRQVLREAGRATSSDPWFRLRRVATIIPAGLMTPVEVSELLPPISMCPQIHDEHITAYEAALEKFHQRDWEKALEHLAKAPEDAVNRFLFQWIGKKKPPRDWNGAITFD